MTVEKPNRSITINDLELSGALLGFLVLESHRVKLKHCHVDTFCDNKTTVVWAYKLLNSKSAIAVYLILFLGLRMHQERCYSMIPHLIEVEDNIMAENISRAFKIRKFFATSNDLVSYFNTPFTIMQNESWYECQVPRDPISCMTAYLCGKLLTMASLLRQTHTGRKNFSIGNNILPQHKSTPSLIPLYLFRTSLS